jgi:hypothetical protein
MNLFKYGTTIHIAETLDHAGELYISMRELIVQESFTYINKEDIKLIITHLQEVIEDQ